MTPCFNEKLFPFFRGRSFAIRTLQVRQENSAVDALLCPQKWQHPWVTHPWQVTKPRPGSVRAAGRADFWWVFLSCALFSGGDGLCWHGARGSPLLARKPDAWSHCLALPGKAGKASAGVIKQHAGAAGPEPPASEVAPHFVTERGQTLRQTQPHSAGCCSSLEHPLLMDGCGARSRMERLFPLASSPAGAFHLLSNVVARAEPHSQQTAVTDGRS